MTLFNPVFHCVTPKGAEQREIRCTGWGAVVGSADQAVGAARWSAG